ncbi:MAG: helix-turn-helix domain-containing protein [Flavobacteriaceae bacterium]|nr:helix-turn-helix domain-containing protein [Flavobacteriaceae bacterium]
MDAELTLTELADEAGISNVMPGRYERGEAIPTMQTWKKLNEALFGGGSYEIEDELIEGDDELIKEAHHAGLMSVLELATIEDLVAALKDRGVTDVHLTFKS